MVDDNEIQAAITSQRIVRIMRSEFADELWDGYLLAASDELVLMLVVSDQILLDGYSVSRIQNITSLDVPSPYADFQERALRLRRQKIVRDVPVDLGSIQRALRSINELADAVIIHREGIDSEVCHVGKVVRLGRTSFDLHLLTPAAEWDEAKTFEYADITRIDFGGLYEDALLRVAKSRA